MVASLLIKVTVLLLAAFVFAQLLRRGTAMVRHRFWSAVFPAVLAVPVLASVLPVLHLPVPVPWMIDTSADVAIGMPQPPEEANSATPRALETAPDVPSPALADRSNVPAPVSARAFPLARLLIVIWSIGAATALAALLTALIRVRYLALDAERVRDPAWLTMAAQIAGRVGIWQVPSLLITPAISTPMAGGLWRPSIFLPLSSRTWCDERRTVVLAHEMAHLAERDPLRHVVARLTLACYWFHPLAWIAARQASIAREEACDEAVLSLGTRPSAYARILLDLAESISPRAQALGALPMVQLSMLEQRVMTILSADVRPARRTALLIPTSALALVTVVVSVAAPRAASTTAMSRQAVSASPNETRMEPPRAESPVWAPEGRDIRFEGEGAVVIALWQRFSRGGSACWPQATPARFNGSMTMRDGVIHEQVGWRDGDRVIQKDFGELRVCMLSEGAEDRSDTDRPSQWIDRARRTVLATERKGRIERLEIVRESGGGQRTTWLVGGAVRPVDPTMNEWRSRLLAVLDTTWEVSSLRGQVSSLRGEISSIHGERSSLNGEISSLRGEVSSMQGQISSVRGHESSLRGEISSIRGHESSLRGAISSENGAISSLNASRYGADSSDRARIGKRIAEHDKEIDRIEQEIRDYNAGARIADVERQIAAFDADGKVAAIEARIKAFDLDRQIAEVERRIAALDVEKRVAAIDRQIDALDADRRVRGLEDRREGELKRLEAAIGSIR